MSRHVHTSTRDTRGSIEPLALRWRDAAAAIGVSERQMFEYMRSGLIPSLKIGRRRLVRVEALDAFLRAREAAGQPGRHGEQEAPADERK